MPESRMMMEKLPREVDIQVSGTGYQLLSYLLQPDQAKVLLDGRSIGMSPSTRAGEAFITTYPGIDFFNREHGDIKALNILPDTIHFNFFDRGYKKVPVHLNSYLDFARQFSLSDSIQLSPDSITLTGPIDVLDSIHTIETEALVLNKLDRSGVYTVKIKRPSDKLNYAPLEVSAKLQVDKYTEAMLDVPVFVDHLLSRDSLGIFPQTVKVKYLVSLKDYKKVNPKLFHIAADAFDLRNGKTENLRLYLRKVPPYVHHVSMEPETVEFIIRKK
jgi:YbbR domain-containing protein